jgi:hypothetical protein
MLAGPLALIGEFVSDRQPKTPVRRKIMVGYEKWALGQPAQEQMVFCRNDLHKSDTNIGE